jgi:hypothetical protein
VVDTWTIRYYIFGLVNLLSDITKRTFEPVED